MCTAAGPGLWDAKQQVQEANQRMQEAYRRMQEAERFSDAWAVHAADYAAALHELIPLIDPLNPEMGAFMARALEMIQSMMDVGEVYRQIKAAQQRGDYVEALRYSVTALNEMTMLTEKVRRLDEAGHSLGQEYQPALDEMRRLLSDMPHPTFFQSELAEGQYLLGQLYHRGDEVQEVQKDLVEAAVWYRQAAERGTSRHNWLWVQCTPMARVHWRTQWKRSLGLRYPPLKATRKRGNSNV